MGDTGDMVGKKTTACVGLPIPSPETAPDQQHGVGPDSSVTSSTMGRQVSILLTKSWCGYWWGGPILYKLCLNSPRSAITDLLSCPSSTSSYGRVHMDQQRASFQSCPIPTRCLPMPSTLGKWKNIENVFTIWKEGYCTFLFWRRNFQIQRSVKKF